MQLTAQLVGCRLQGRGKLQGYATYLALEGDRPLRLDEEAAGSMLACQCASQLRNNRTGAVVTGQGRLGIAFELGAPSERIVDPPGMNRALRKRGARCFEAAARGGCFATPEAEERFV